MPFPHPLKYKLNENHKNPKLWMYNLQSLHEQPSGFQVLIFDLNSESDFEFFISIGTSSQVFGPLYLIVSMPLLTVLALGITQSLSFIRLFINISCTGAGERLFLTYFTSSPV